MSKSTKVCPKCNAHIKGIDGNKVIIGTCPDCGSKLDYFKTNIHRNRK